MNAPLTAEMIRLAAQKIHDAPYTVCEHVVNPRGFSYKGWQVCANCFQLVEIKQRP